MAEKDTTVQGEGNYDAAREYNKSAKEFVESGKAEKARQELKDITPEEEQELERAEAERDKRIKETDPAVVRDYDKPS